MTTQKKIDQDNPVAEYALALAEIIGSPDAGNSGRKITPDYYKEFGKELANAQEPPRAIPYHDFTIAGWTKGELLPTPQARAALTKLLDEEYAVPEGTLERLDKLQDAALKWQAEQKNQPTELTHAMKHALMLSGKSQADLARAMAAKNAAWDEAREENADKNKIATLPITSASISYVLNGFITYRPSRIFTYSTEQILKPPFSLRAIHENALRERADELWLTAEREGNLGGLIHACRVRLGESLESFAKRIGQIAGKNQITGENKTFGTAPTCLSWENNHNLPIGGNHKTGETLYEPIVKAMKLADVAKNGLSLSIPTPWFDAAKEKTFRQVFSCAAQKFNKGKRACERKLPEKTPVPSPDPRAVPADLRIYGGTLTNKLFNGHEKF